MVYTIIHLHLVDFYGSLGPANDVLLHPTLRVVCSSAGSAVSRSRIDPSIWPRSQSVWEAQQNLVDLLLLVTFWVGGLDS